DQLRRRRRRPWPRLPGARRARDRGDAARGPDDDRLRRRRRGPRPGVLAACLQGAVPLRRPASPRLAADDPAQHQRQHAPPAASRAGRRHPAAPGVAPGLRGRRAAERRAVVPRRGARRGAARRRRRPGRAVPVRVDPRGRARPQLCRGRRRAGRAGGHRHVPAEPGPRAPPAHARSHPSVPRRAVM
ncbi:MAG: RNA polymerase ECF-type sigma factor, partial [uncultured Nocardioides sp.]